MIDESNIPTDEQSLIFRLRKRAEIRRQIPTRKSVQEGTRDRIADLLEEAADKLEEYERVGSRNKAQEIRSYS
jgi:vacuolar-type H+-ATPase subunit I/STV1